MSNNLLTLEPRCCNCGIDPRPNPVEVWVVGPNGVRASTSIYWCRACAKKAGIRPNDDPGGVAPREEQR